MSRRVFVHIGLPKTGTSYLQAIVWPHRDDLRRAGLLLPGREKRDHLLTSMIVRDDAGVRRRGPGAAEAWDVVRAQVEAHEGDSLISHEFLCSATAEQAERMVAELAPAEVHVVVTAREPLGLFTSSWQESLKNKGTTPMRDYGVGESDDPRDVWDWRALDLGLVLERWGGAVPPDRLHVIPAPRPPAPATELWRRFCGVIGLDPDLVSPPAAPANQSMGVVEAETLRRVNEQLTGSWTGYDRGRWIRSYLADQRLVAMGGDRFWPGPEQVEDCRRRGRRAVELLRSSSHHVVGDLDSLLVPDDLPERRTPDTVSEAEVARVAVALVARLLDDVREARTASGPEAGVTHSLLRRLWSKVTDR